MWGRATSSLSLADDSGALSGHNSGKRETKNRLSTAGKNVVGLQAGPPSASGSMFLFRTQEKKTLLHLWWLGHWRLVQVKQVSRQQSRALIEGGRGKDRQGQRWEIVSRHDSGSEERALDETPPKLEDSVSVGPPCSPRSIIRCRCPKLCEFPHVAAALSKRPTTVLVWRLRGEAGCSTHTSPGISRRG